MKTVRRGVHRLNLIKLVVQKETSRQVSGFTSYILYLNTYTHIYIYIYTTNIVITMNPFYTRTMYIRVYIVFVRAYV